ncbi:MAG: DUF1858 domain-containing protein [Candidatus Nitrospinota bacterium M3_3B_026]
MDRYGKLFIKTSVIYLALGMLFGLHMSLADHNMGELRFIHVHVMLLGFMAMMIYGVAYHILPRFNARPVPYPSWIPAQYWLANIGLLGMIGVYALGGFWTTGPLRMIFGAFSAVEGVAILMFVINIFSVLRDEPAQKEPSAPPAAPSEEKKRPEIKLSPSMKISEIVEKWPGLQQQMIDAGLGDVAGPGAVQTIGRMVTLQDAAKRAGKDTFQLMAELEGKRLVGAGEEGANGEREGAPASAAGGERIERGQLATPKTLIGPLLETYPDTSAIFEKHYGEACFTCPGQSTETVEQTAAMHGMETGTILDEINGVIRESLEK